MGRYNKFKYERKEKPETNPLLRGVGCIIMVVLPLITFALTVFFILPVAATGLVPWQLLGHVNFPAWVFHTPVLRDIAIFLRGIDNLWLGVTFFIIILILLSGISSLIYVAVLQIIGPPRYSEKDAAPTGYKPKVYKR
jgi:hypothetical protein